VHELPQQVVGGLRDLLRHERVGAGRRELPLGRGAAEPDGQAAAVAGSGKRAVGLRLEGDDDVIALGEKPDVRAAEGKRGKGPLADDHGMHELHGDVVRIRPARG
jgi:hypothetical protein